MFRFATVTCAAIALAACSSGSDEVDADGDGTVSSEEAAEAVAKVRPLEPGQYSMSMELIELTDPTMSEEEIAQAKQFFSSMSGMAPPRCLNEEEAKEGMMGVAETIQNGDCTIDSMTSDADGMRGEMTCKAENGEAKVTMQTTSTGTESEMTMNVVEPTADGEEKAVTMKVGMTRTGDCA
ncbi:DUF3617 family protein [Erythrobacter vulgaris]|uniref:DUF3617 family protein n=1 Tax=Qipengyuania vulgaris TaxID=291985 RepID=A0A844XLJ2_9SPHN|nr:DUF3617 family protein [Qipengyuania vulgaris]MXO47055.1 DUF3617 family protein [Qipengyuania vulgaris]